MGNYKYRLTTSINYLARNLKQIGRLEEVEILVTDWNSETPIAKVLPLLTEAGEITQFIYVPPNVAAKSQQPDQVFHSSCSMNVALRRATGEFLMVVDADTLMPLLSLKAICEFLEGKVSLPLDRERCFFLGNRRHIPWEVVQRELSLEEWDVYLLLNAGELVRDRGWPGLGVCQIAWLAHRSIWHSCWGFNEQLHYWGWNDAELTLRITQRYPWVNLESLGVLMFHMEHWPRNHRTIPPQRNPHIVKLEFTANDPNWGLGNQQLEIQSGENIGSNFDLPYPEKIAVWQLSPGQILAQINSPAVQAHLAAVRQIAQTTSAALAGLELVAWYSLYHYPRNYLEFGTSSSYGTAVVAAACPGTAIYAIDSWQATDNYCPLPPDSTTGLLRTLDYQGYIRLVTGEVSTALQRLRDSFIGDLTLDLVWLRIDWLGENALGQLCELIPYLGAGGAIALSAANATDFQQIWQQLPDKFPDLTYLPATSNTGLVLAAQLRSDASTTLLWDNQAMPMSPKISASLQIIQLEQLLQAQNQIKAMESSKFWKMRTAWLRLKQAIAALIPK
jgi:hypothetical protein